MMTTRASIKAQPPLQERSRRTQMRILDALELMLETHRFEEISVQGLARKAGVSIGSFYARFPSKEILLPALYERWDEQVRSRGTQLKQLEEARSLSLEELARAVVGTVAKRNRTKQSFMRAVALHARQHPELLDGAMRRRRSEIHRVWVNLFLEHQDRIGHPDPVKAIQLGLFMVASTIREKIVFCDAPHASSFRISDRRLVTEVTSMFLAYINIQDSSSTKASLKRK